MPNPIEHTCESKITGKTVRVRHAVEADAIYISEKLTAHGLDMGEPGYEGFVVATENGKLIAFGRVRPAGEGETFTVFNSRRESHISELIVKHMLEVGPA